MNISIIIPAHNEEPSIGLVIDEIPKTGVIDIIVVNNASTDNTAQIAQQHGARVINSSTKGYGSACLTGLAHVKAETDIIVILDGDHSDYPEDLPGLVNPIINKTHDFVIGSRVLGDAEKGSLTFFQQRGNAFACFLIYILFGKKYTDMGPFRAIKKDKLDALHMKDPNYGWNAEMQTKAVKQGLRIIEVPVKYRNRIGFSKISGTIKGTIGAGTKIIWTIIKERFN